MALAFGTSGLRGIASDLTDEVCIRFTRAFIAHFKTFAQSSSTRACIIAGDLRESTPRIVNSITRGLLEEGFDVLDAGRVPTPALAYECVTRKLPGIMVTGSHIPADRNGIKFYLPWGEVLKSDEVEITRLEREGFLGERAPVRQGVVSQISADLNFVSRYVSFFGSDALSGTKVVFFEHSSVAREIAPKILESLGAQVIRVGRSETFVSVDTEALENVRILTDYVRKYEADALFSTDGDGDRPLLLDEQGAVVRGDQLGMLAAHVLMADSVSTPVSTSTALDKTGWFEHIQRCRIGSPFVVEEMEKAKKAGFKKVVGFEANGGFLLGSSITGQSGLAIMPLATRDSILPVLLCLVQSKKRKVKLSELVLTLPKRFTASDLIRNFPIESSQRVLKTLQNGAEPLLDKRWTSELGKVREIDQTDGYRVTFAKEDILHFRASGNAPEFRVYSESENEKRAMEINQMAKDWIRELSL